MDQGAVAGGRQAAVRGRDRVSTTNHLQNMRRNTNHEAPLKGKAKQKIILTRRYKTANEDANYANQELIDTYNAMMEIGDSYELALVEVPGGKKELKDERKELRKSFDGLLAKIALQKSAVIRLGAQPVPFPTQVQNTLPEALQVMIKEKAQ